MRGFNNIAVDTFEFLQLVADSGICDFLTLYYADPEKVLERIHSIDRDMSERYKGLPSRQRTSFQMELMKNPDLFSAAVKGFLELEDADQFVEFAHIILTLRFGLIKRQWNEKDKEAENIVTKAIKEAAKIAEKKLNPRSYVFQKESRSLRSFIEFAMIYMEHFPFDEIPFSRKIEFANKLREHLFLIANSLPDKDSTKSQIHASLDEITSDFELPETIGAYSRIKDIFKVFDTHAFVLK